VPPCRSRIMFSVVAPRAPGKPWPTPSRSCSGRRSSCSSAAFLLAGRGLNASAPAPPPVRGQTCAESIAVDYARRPLCLDGGRGRARRGGRRFPRVAATLVLDEQGGREDIACSRLVDFGRGVRVDVL